MTTPTSSEPKPTLSRARRIWRATKVVVTVFSGALAIVGISLAIDRGLLNITNVDVRLKDDVADTALYDRIRESLAPQLEKIKGQNIFSLDLKKLTRTILSDRRVQEVNITRRLPGHLQLELTPKKPVLNLLNSDGRLSPISVDASLLPAVEISQAFDLPVLRGKVFKSDPSKRELALNLVAEMPQEGMLTEKTLSEITYSKDEGYSLRTLNSPGKIILGEGNFREKFKRLNEVLNYLYDRSLTWRILDARFSKKVVVKLHDQT